jgi:hypothetical protein
MSKELEAQGGEAQVLAAKLQLISLQSAALHYSQNSIRSFCRPHVQTPYANQPDFAGFNLINTVNQIALRPSAMNTPTLRSTTLLLLITICSFPSLCHAFGRAKYIALPIPELSASATAGSKGELFLGAIEDVRIFADSPTEASTPSVDDEKVAKCSKELLGTIIGRNRGTMGGATANILLPKGGDNVEKRTRAFLQESLKQQGYTVTDKESAAITATTKVDQFYGWVIPAGSYWMKVQIIYTITFVRDGKPIVIAIKGDGDNRAMTPSLKNWQLAFNKSFLDTHANFVGEMTKAGL